MLLELTGQGFRYDNFLTLLLDCFLLILLFGGLDVLEIGLKMATFSGHVIAMMIKCNIAFVTYFLVLLMYLHIYIHKYL